MDLIPKMKRKINKTITEYTWLCRHHDDETGCQCYDVREIIGNELIKAREIIFFCHD
jgi:hypothetical protein